MRHLIHLIVAFIFISGPLAYGQCGTFDESDRKQEGLEAHSLYRELYKQKNYDEAFPYWKKAYEIAPAANGKTTKHFTNGVMMYNAFYRKETDAAKKSEYANIINDLYSQHIECYPKDKNKLIGKRAVNNYYKLADTDRKVIFDDAKACLDALGNEASMDILYPLACSSVSLFTQEKLTEDEARAMHAKINEIVDHNITNAADDKTKGKYEKTKAQVNTRFDAIASALFDCDYFRPALVEEYNADPDNYEHIKKVRQKLVQNGCGEDDPIAKEIEGKMRANIAAENAANADARWESLPNANKGAKYLKEKNYPEAIKHYNLAIDEASDPTKKGDYHYVLAQVYFNQKQFSKSRENARKAAKYKPNWGKPYILIGSLYASSTRSCGDAFTGRMVALAAIDKYSKAKQLDPSVASDADSKIARLAGSKPTREQVFERGLKDGQSYKIGCWIQESVTIRSTKGY